MSGLVDVSPRGPSFFCVNSYRFCPLPPVPSLPVREVLSFLSSFSVGLDNIKVLALVTVTSDS